MILATDVHYFQSKAKAAAVLFDNWFAEEPEREYTCEIQDVKDYKSGSFYKRELPCILTLINEHRLSADCIVVDGYVYLNDFKPGLGKHLFDALQGTTTIIGVAKNSFPGITEDHKIYRGESENPLFVTSTGDIAAAKDSVLSMHGDFRIPTLLKRVDRLCREI